MPTWNQVNRSGVVPGGTKTTPDACCGSTSATDSLNNYGGHRAALVLAYNAAVTRPQIAELQPAVL